MKNEIIKSYKGFNKDLTCRGFQYEVGKEYECDNAIICEEGFHACENPIDCFYYYDPAESVFHEVEQRGKLAKHDDDSKVASTKIKIGLKIDIKTIVECGIKFIFSKVTWSDKSQATGYKSGSQATGDNSGSQATGDNSGSQATGDYSGSQATGDNSGSQATGDYSGSQATGYNSGSQATGDNSGSQATGYKSGSQATGDNSGSQATGNYSGSQATGDNSGSQATGDNSGSQATGYKSGSQATGDNSGSQATGNYSGSQATGDNSGSQATGDNSGSQATGNYSGSQATGYKSGSQATGDYSMSSVNGYKSKTSIIDTDKIKSKNSVAMGIGIYCEAKASLGNWIILAESEKDKKGDWNIIFIKSAQVDGKKIKADTFYTLKNGKFVEVK
jgi:hypothetical protein